MCGIAGIYFRQEHNCVDRSMLVRMRDRMVHRGPDACGLYVDEAVGFAHRRLSIIDIQGSQQPLTNEDESVWVIFNGEIYNYRSLRKFLLQRGHQFKTEGDTEVIVHLYEEYGPEFVEHLNGMFAIALWDQKEKSLLLIRDRLGIKPLYYYNHHKHIVFASEIKAILASSFYAPEINDDVLYSYFSFNSIYGPQTLFKGIYELEPGHMLKLNGDELLIYKYWDITSKRQSEYTSEAESLEQLDAYLQQAVQRRLISDVPVGAFLSGGVDSSLLVAYMSELRAEPVKTFSIGFKEDEANEFNYSRWVARHFQTDHHEYFLSEQTFLEALPHAIWLQDEPLRHFASVPLYFLSKYAKSEVTVMLSGEGADELFLGYRAYRLAQLQTYLNRIYQTVVPASFWELGARLGPKLTKRKIGSKVIRRLSLAPPTVALTYSSPIPGLPVQLALQDQRQDRVNPDYFEWLFTQAPVDGFLHRYAYTELKTHLVSLLMKQDKMSMGASIETRVPFLDHELVEFAFSMPETMKIRGRTGKYLVKKLAERKLPKELIYRQKMGFPVPLTKWLQRGQFKQYLVDVLLDPSTIRRGVFNPSFVEQHLGEVERARWGEDSDACSLLWGMLNFELWCRIFIDDPSVRYAAP
jgi:asparagine synthase (glutamine-hydrolysing)